MIMHAYMHTQDTLYTLHTLCFHQVIIADWSLDFSDAWHVMSEISNYIIIFYPIGRTIPYINMYDHQLRIPIRSAG